MRRPLRFLLSVISRIQAKEFWSLIELKRTKRFLRSQVDNNETERMGKLICAQSSQDWIKILLILLAYKKEFQVRGDFDLLVVKSDQIKLTQRGDSKVCLSLKVESKYSL